MNESDLHLGPYRLYERIGGGGFATVYLARDTRTNEIVAVKVLHQHLAQDAQFIARFRHEAEALQKIPPHRNIVRLHEFGNERGTYYLAMDYLEGKDLAQILAERKRLSVNEALNITTQIAQALDVAHRNGLVHRDIKPSNVKITPNGSVQVMDFGIARAAEGTQVTQSGTLMGTPDYIAPEIWEGKRADIRADIYSLGALLYEMLTGSAPFHSDTPAAIMRRHLMEQPRDLRAARGDVPANVDAVISKMIAKEPTARFQTPAELLNALHGEMETTPATVIVSRPKVTPQSHRNLTIPLLALAGGGALIVFLVMLLLTSNNKDNSLNVSLTRTSIAIALTVPTQTPISTTGIPSATAIPTTSTATLTRVPSTFTPTATHVPDTATVTATFTTSIVDSTSAVPTETFVSPTSTPAPTETSLPPTDTPAGSPTQVSAVKPTVTSISKTTDYSEMLLVSDETHSFWIDKRPVSVGMFEKFVNATGLVTLAEARGYSDVYTSTGNGWPNTKTAPSVNWRNPTGDGAADPNADVVQITFDEGQKYCRWAGKRLPTLAERKSAVTNPEILQRENTAHISKDNLYEYLQDGSKGGATRSFREMIFTTGTMYTMNLIPNNLISVRCAMDNQ